MVFVGPMDDNQENERFRNAFGAALDQQIKKHGLSQAKLAALVGTSRSYLNQTMQGNKTPSPEWADRVADASGVDEVGRARLHAAAAISAGYKIEPLLKKSLMHPRGTR